MSDLGFFEPAKEEAQPSDPAIITPSAHLPAFSAPPASIPAEAKDAEITNANVADDADLLSTMVSLWNSSEEHFVVKFKLDVVTKIWDEELLPSNFALKKLALLESSQYLEKYLLLTYKSFSSWVHTLSIILLINEKYRQKLSLPWTQITPIFADLFHNALKFLLDDDAPTPAVAIKELLVKIQIVMFLINMYQSLDVAAVRDECIKLVGIGMWTCLDPQRLELEVEKSERLVESWVKSEKRFKKRDEEAQQKISFERRFFSKLIIQFFTYLENIGNKQIPDDEVGSTLNYLNRILELFIDLESQIPTRRFFNMVFQDHVVTTFIKTSLFYQSLVGGSKPSKKKANDAKSFDTLPESVKFKQLFARLQYYSRFPVDEISGEEMTKEQLIKRHYGIVKKLQRLAFLKYREELEEFSLANVGAVDEPERIREMMKMVDVGVLRRFCKDVAIRLGFGEFEEMDVDMEESELDGHDRVDSMFTKSFLVEVLVETYAKRESLIEKDEFLSVYPDEKELFDETVIPFDQNFTNNEPLSIPKLNLQYLTLHDYLMRNYRLHRMETNFGIRNDIEDAVKRMKPRHNPEFKTANEKTLFGGWAKMGVVVDKVEITKTEAPKIGTNYPSLVEAQITYNVGKFPESVQNEWDSIKPLEVMFLVCVQPEIQLASWAQTNGSNNDTKFQNLYGVKRIRGVQVVERVIEQEPEEPYSNHRYFVSKRIKKDPNVRKLLVTLDPWQYSRDAPTVYGEFNVLVRRKTGENNFKSMQETIKDLMSGVNAMPEWLADVFLGYGDPRMVGYEHIKMVQRAMNDGGMFQDFDHLRETIGDFEILPKDVQILNPPYILTFPSKGFKALEDGSAVILKSARKNVNDSVLFDDKKMNEKFEREEIISRAAEESADQYGKVVVMEANEKEQTLFGYGGENNVTGRVRYTKAQVQAVRSGTSPGLTLIVGPPGTGKTDVAVQIVNNIYINNPTERTLIITKSNQALNQLFEKISSQKIDSRHLLRLGHGEEDLDGDWSKSGRVNSFLAQRISLLQLVDKLAKSLEVTGAHGNSCETAGYFFQYHVAPRWESYCRNIEGMTEEQVVEKFPFSKFFNNYLYPPVNLFKDISGSEAKIEKAEMAYRYISHEIFKPLERLRPFEILKSTSDRMEYMLLNEARVIAMTCTHASIKRKALLSSGFRFDNIIIEEAGQMLEIESVIPMLLQSPVVRNGKLESNLKRVVMIGDDNQLGPVVKNSVLEKYGGFSMSLFMRFVKVGVKTCLLDRQGRCRPSIADLFRWKYGQLEDGEMLLKDLGAVETDEFKKANKGFVFEYQVIDVPNFMGKGETEPVPHFFQNEGEAEYVVAVYMYMRLLGYPAEKITILTTYNGQRELINDILKSRCGWHPLFGYPSKVSTVDQYQGQQNDYVLLSLVRTKNVGYLRDVRRLIVAMSRARLGLYIFARNKLFADCSDLEPVWKKLNERPDALFVRIGELYGVPNEKGVDRKIGDVTLPKNKGKWTAKRVPFVHEIEDVSHMGSYVQQMLNERMEWLKKEKEREQVLEGEAMDVEESE
ncbi:hypothetical protein HK098_003602 [Nowakowskiella sp. JEL0407]|nr:hypothetical protein HK098_003602 [Nowakowskiella sp. JEL0407]